MVVALLAICSSNIATAALINVSEIRISSAVDDWLQVSEFVAWNNSTNSDLALLSSGATVSASDFYTGKRSCNANSSDASCAIDGVAFVDYPNIFHGNNPNSFDTVLTIMLAAPSTIDWIEIFGRNGCCQKRDVYNISFYDSAGNNLANLLSVKGATSQSSNRVDVSEPSILAVFSVGLFMLAFRKKA